MEPVKSFDRNDVAHIGKSVIIKGELSGSEDIFLDGEVEGKVELRGSMWSARNTSGVTLIAGQRARVAAVDGLTLAVIPE